MATVQNILDRAATIYPSDRSDADQILSISRIQQRLWIKLGRDNNQFTIDSTDVTVADQLEYDLPSGCEIHNIVNAKIQVETTETSSEYEDFEYRELDQVTDDYGNFYTRGSTSGKYYLYEDGAAIEDADRTIKILYYGSPTIIDSADDTPTLNSEYHDYLIYALVAENAATGEDPDTTIANYWTKFCEEYYQEIKYRIDDNFNTSSARSPSPVEMM